MISIHRLREKLNSDWPAPGGAAERWASRLRLLPYAIALTVLVLVLLESDKFWATNDDGHMAMIAHGYGMTDTPSPGIVYSNVIWGWVVMKLGSVGGIQGYTLGAYALMVLSGLALCFALYRSRAPAWGGAALLVMAYVPALINMQFTITAGYLAVAALALAWSARREDGPWPWLGAAVLLLLSSLVRLDECLFVLLLATPFGVLRWRRDLDALMRRRGVVALGAALLAIGACAAVDHSYYSGAEWQEFRQMNALRRPFTDFGLSEYYSSFEHRHELEGSGMSVNDMRLIGQRAFLDTEFFDAARLRPLIQKATADARVDFNLRRWDEALRPFGSFSMYAPLALLALALALGRRRKAAVAASALFVAVMLFFWLWGRPGIVHVYKPAEVVLAVLALLSVDWRRHWLVPLAGAFLFWVALDMSWHANNAGRRQDQRAAEQVDEKCDLPTDQLLVAWGPPALNDRYLYRPMSPMGGECGLQLYLVNTLALVPGSLDKLYRHTHGKSLLQALLDGQQIQMLSDSVRIGMLQVYLRAHFQATLVARQVASQNDLHLYDVQVSR
ncbi:MAG TPA: hypothetical protein VGM16_00560 [Gammaproteobacteria bacterium]|jgi:hypothetical protein